MAHRLSSVTFGCNECMNAEAKHLVEILALIAQVIESPHNYSMLNLQFGGGLCFQKQYRDIKPEWAGPGGTKDQLIQSLAA